MPGEHFLQVLEVSSSVGKPNFPMACEQFFFFFFGLAEFAYLLRTTGWVGFCVPLCNRTKDAC